MAKAPAKQCTASPGILPQIVLKNGEVNRLSIELSSAKEDLSALTKDLSEESRKIFIGDLGEIGAESAPLVYGNHEYPYDDHLITVNYRMDKGGLTFKLVGGKPASEVLTKIVGAKDYKKLFEENKTIKDDQATLEQVYVHHPELFDIRLRDDIDLPVLQSLREAHPECFTLQVKDEEGYLNENKSAVVETEVSTTTGFIEKVSSLPDDVQLKLKDFTRKVLINSTSGAVKIGNKA